MTAKTEQEIVKSVLDNLGFGSLNIRKSPSGRVFATAICLTGFEMSTSCGIKGNTYEQNFAVCADRILKQMEGY